MTQPNQNNHNLHNLHNLDNQNLRIVIIGAGMAGILSAIK